MKSNSQTYSLESRVGRDKEENPPSKLDLMARWSFPVVVRVPGNRADSHFSNWFTYKWVARVSWEGRRAKVGAFAQRTPRAEISRSLMSGFWTSAG